MNVVDSSGWLEYFAGGSNTEFFALTVEATEQLIIPSLSLYEVFKRVLQQRGETEGLRAVAYMQHGQVIDLDATLALGAAKLSVDLKLPMADSVILATARAYDATLWTQDKDFDGLEGVEYVAKT